MIYKIPGYTSGILNDVVVSDENGQLNIGEAPTADNAFINVRGGLEGATDRISLVLEQPLDEAEVFIYSSRSLERT